MRAALMISLPLSLLLLGIHAAPAARAATADSKSAAAEGNRVLRLPEITELGVDMFAGYLNVSDEPGVDRHVFYSFTESEGDPSRDPVVVWLQGGPGCSPVGTGGFKLLGPFFFKPDRRNTSSQALVRNEHSWTKAASLLMLDTPLFTGFSSSSDNVTDRYWGDENTTALHLASLLAFYERFPEYRDRPLFLAGHSYAGHYIPLFAQAVLEYNQHLNESHAGGGTDGGGGGGSGGGSGGGAAAQRINLQGYVVGNPWTDPALDNEGAVEYWYTQGMVQADTYEGLKQHCNMSSVVLWRTDGESGVHGECAKYRDAALAEGNGYYEYGVNAPLCALGPDGTPLLEQPAYADIPSPTYDPCAPQRLAAYFNRADVQEALHAIQPGDAALPWKACNSRGITYSYDSLATSVVPVHRALLEAGLRALVYSGDTDGVVPTRSTRSWVESLDLPAAGSYRPWQEPANETAGYVTPYKGLTFVTLHDAGHHGPYFKPERALHMIRAFLADELP